MGVGAFGDKGQEILDTIRASLAEASPSKATMEMGANLVAGLQIGFDNTEFSASGFGEKVLNAIRSELDGVAEDAMSDFWNEAKEYKETGTIGENMKKYGTNTTAGKLQRNSQLSYMEE